jgi:hypothetical protein
MRRGDAVAQWSSVVPEGGYQRSGSSPCARRPARSIAYIATSTASAMPVTVLEP